MLARGGSEARNLRSLQLKGPREHDPGCNPRDTRSRPPDAAHAGALLYSLSVSGRVGK